MKVGFIAVQAMKSTVEGREEDPREDTTIVVGLGRLRGEAWHPRGEGPGILLQVMMSGSVTI